MGFETTLDHVLVWLCDDRWAGKSLLVCCSTQSVTVQLQNCVTKWFFDKWSSCWIELNAAGAAGSGFTCGWFLLGGTTDNYIRGGGWIINNSRITILVIANWYKWRHTTTGVVVVSCNVVFLSMEVKTRLLRHLTKSEKWFCSQNSLSWLLL